MTPDEQRELLARAVAGQLTPEEAEQLLNACRRDPVLLEKLTRLHVIERLLAYVHLYSADDTFVLEIDERLQRAALLPFRGFHLPSWQVPHWKWAMAAGVVLLAVGGFALVRWVKSDAGLRPLVVRMEAVVTSPGQLPLRVGQLMSSARVQLAAGLVELKLPRGVSLILEGPADFEMLRPLQGFLRRGKTVVGVQPQARGFILQSPRARLVDLGTEFGVTVADSGETEVHVLKGLVTATPRDATQAIELRENQALRLTRDTVQRLAADADAFVTDLPPRAQGSIGLVHWAFDERLGQISRNSGSGLAGPEAIAHLRSMDTNRSGPDWIIGQFGYGLSFNGEGDYLDCEFKGVPGNQARTVAFWVKVPHDFEVRHGYGIINWGTVARPGAAWQISINPEPSEGPIGRLRVGVHRGGVVGTSDLRDDRWHHCAVVMYGGRHPDASTHVLLYVDGDLEPSATKAVHEIATDTDDATAHHVWIGRNLAPRPPGDPMLRGFFFKGCLDEVFILNAALNQEQISWLMSHNRLPESQLAQEDWR